MSTPIPDYLQEAAQIFLDELNTHLLFFNSTLEGLEKPQLGVPFDATRARLLAEKFHLIKGASGFLQLTSLKNTSAEAEKYFRDQWSPASAPEDVRLRLIEAVQVVSAHRDLLAKQLQK